MTRVTKPVARLVDSSYGELVITVAPAGLLVRKKGSRTAYGPIAYGSIYNHGAQLEADRQRAEKNTKPRVKRGLLTTGGR